jgi:hypothetical protein
VPAQCVDRQALSFDVDPYNLAQDYRSVGLVPQNVADRRSYVAFGEDAGRHLIEQRLKKVVVGAVDHRHVDIGSPKCLCGEEAGESGADDHHMMRTATTVGMVCVNGHVGSEPYAFWAGFSLIGHF